MTLVRTAHWPMLVAALVAGAAQAQVTSAHALRSAGAWPSAEKTPTTTPQPRVTLDAMLAQPAATCIVPAANYHRVNYQVLWAILQVESRMQPHAVNTNRNGTVDVGLGGINSIHLPELQRHGVTAQDLRDHCVSTYVAAWFLSQRIAQHGNTWFGVAAYHSVTPYFNRRYQVLLHNALKEVGVLQGAKQKVPPLVPVAVTAVHSEALDKKTAP